MKYLSGAMIKKAGMIVIQITKMEDHGRHNVVWWAHIDHRAFAA